MGLSAIYLHAIVQAKGNTLLLFLKQNVFLGHLVYLCKLFGSRVATNAEQRAQTQHLCRAPLCVRGWVFGNGMQSYHALRVDCIV